MAAFAAGSTAELRQDLDAAAMGRALWNRKRLILLPTIVVALLATVIVNLIPPRYKSEARVLYEGRENVFLRPEAEKNPPDQVVGDLEAITNQVQIALSREVALDVIKQFKLAENPEFDPVIGGISPLKYLMIFFGLSRDPFQMTPEERVLASFNERLTAYAVEKSRVIVIEFQSADPELAAKVANAVAESYLQRRQVAKQDQSRGASQWLSGEIDKLRAKVAEAEARTEAFRAKSNLFVGTNNTTLSNQQLGEFNTQLGAARAQKADSETRAKAIREMLRKGQPIESSDIVNSDLIRRLSEQRVTLRAQLAEQSSTLLDGHPRIKELKAQIGDLDQQIRGEAEKLVRSLENDAKIADARVEALTTNLDALKKQAATTNEQDVQLRALERESKAQRDLLEAYLAKYREATARESIGSAPIADARIISYAIVSNTPSFPKKMPTILIASIATLMLMCGVVLTGEFLRAGEEGIAQTPVARAAVSAPASALVRAAPQEPPAPSMAVSTLSEVIRKLRDPASGARRVAVFGTGTPGGANIVPLHLARALASEARVVLIDAGVNAPGFASASSDPQAAGLAELVRGTCSFRDIITRDKQSRLHLVSGGQMGPDGSAIVASPRFAMAIEALARSYDYLVLDASGIPDSVVPRIVPLAPSAVLVVSEGASRMRATYDRLVSSGFADVAVVVGGPAATPADQRRSPAARVA